MASPKNVFIDTNVLMDEIQYFSAVHGAADYLVSRNPKHFKNVDLPILAPDEFIVALGAQEK